MPSSPLTLAKINAELARRGIAERLARGEGFFYFYGGDCASWSKTVVWVKHLKDRSIEMWVIEYYSLKLKKPAGSRFPDYEKFVSTLKK